MKAWARALIAAVQTLTRLPVPSVPSAPDAATLARSAVFFPLVGFLIGAIGWGVHRATGEFLPAGWCAAAVLVAYALATGALHEDGLADVADAFGSQRDREGLLRVMKDSRIGAYGALALMLATLFRWQGLAGLSPGAIAPAVLSSQVLSRAALVVAAWLAGPATDGTGGGFARSLRTSHVVGMALVSALLLAPFAELNLAAAALAAAAVAALAALYFRRRLQGVTGDCLGSVAVVAEIAVLGVYAAS